MTIQFNPTQAKKRLEWATPPDLAVYLKHIETYCTWINYMRQMFEDGKPKDVVRDAVTNLHRPKEYWEQKLKEQQIAVQVNPTTLNPSS